MGRIEPNLFYTKERYTTERIGDVPLAFKKSTKGWSKKSLDLLSFAANGNAEAQYELGLRCLNGTEVPQDEKLAIDWLIKSSNQGFEDAQYLLGTCYESGTGVEENQKVALGFYTKAADAANKMAQFALGEHYFGEELYDIAVNWYTRSARQGYPPAQYQLGFCYYYGRGSIQAEEMALVWLNKAADKKYKPASDLLRRIGR